MKELISKVIFSNRFIVFQLLQVWLQKSIHEFKGGWNHKSFLESIIFGFKEMIGQKILFAQVNKAKQTQKLLKHTRFSYEDGSMFYYYIDEHIYFHNFGRTIGNLPVDYSVMVKSSVEELKAHVKNGIQNRYSQDAMVVLEAIEDYLKELSDYLSGFHSGEAERIGKAIDHMINQSANDRFEALQRILIWNQLLNQTNHPLMGIGRLDVILNSFKVEDESVAKEELEAFCKALHLCYEMKSQALLGDTGQLIIIGGLQEDGSYFANQYTYLLLDVIKELQLPDPKLMLRAHSSMPKELMEKAVLCISEGNGSPLISNDALVIDKMQEFGYEKAHCYNYVVSACWEPMVLGKSLDQNNLYNFSFPEALNNVLLSENIESVSSFDEFLQKLETEIVLKINLIMKEVDQIKWEADPLLSLFFEDCLKKGKDISEGGAYYNNYGILTVGMPNAVDALLNIKKMVFEEKEYNISDLVDFLKANLDGNDMLLSKIKNNELYFGKDEKEVIDLTNCLFAMVKNPLKGNKNRLGGLFKIGLSSPSYVSEGSKILASLDGRKGSMPFRTHISSDKIDAYTELLSFASQLDYSNGGFNGNVVDLMTSPDFIRNNIDKVVDFLLLGLQQGFFQLQMNVVSSDILIKAKKNPEKFPNLIVRVWGFSAYYVDLPEDYKDLLIDRALRNEKKIA